MQADPAPTAFAGGAAATFDLEPGRALARGRAGSDLERRSGGAEAADVSGFHVRVQAGGAATVDEAGARPEPQRAARTRGHGPDFERAFDDADRRRGARTTSRVDRGDSFRGREFVAECVAEPDGAARPVGDRDGLVRKRELGDLAARRDAADPGVALDEPDVAVGAQSEVDGAVRGAAADREHGDLAARGDAVDRVGPGGGNPEVAIGADDKSARFRALREPHLGDRARRRDSPDRIGVLLGEPQRPVGAGDDPVGIGLGRRQRIGGHLPGRRRADDRVVLRVGGPEGAVGPARDPGQRRATAGLEFDHLARGGDRADDTAPFRFVERPAAVAGEPEVPVGPVGQRGRVHRFAEPERTGGRGDGHGDRQQPQHRERRGQQPHRRQWIPSHPHLTTGNRSGARKSLSGPERFVNTSGPAGT